MSVKVLKPKQKKMEMFRKSEKKTFQYHYLVYIRFSSLEKTQLFSAKKNLDRVRATTEGL